MDPRYFVIYKPYCMVSQFVSPYIQRLLGDLDYTFPEGTHAVGRLDNLSEGLLILTTDKSLTRRLLHPSRGHMRRYAVLVRGTVTEESLKHLQDGVSIDLNGRGDYLTSRCDVRILEQSPLPERDPPYIQYGPHTWLEFELYEGKNKQIRKMCRAVRHEVQRLVRTHIEDLDVLTMSSGQVVEMDKVTIEKFLKLDSAQSR
jgi:23S rRNA pseudouridine2457 synthase